MPKIRKEDLNAISKYSLVFVHNCLKSECSQDVNKAICGAQRKTRGLENREYIKKSILLIYKLLSFFYHTISQKRCSRGCSTKRSGTKYLIKQ